MTKEQKFYKVLQDVFIGAKIEGEGGFVNLMRIKSNYYRKIEESLKSDIDKALKKYPSFRDELFDKLYSFFSRYFTESGSIYFNSTPFHNNIYEKVYTDEKDVILFWKTQMLYYVKTDRIFRSLPVEFDPEGKQASNGAGGLKFYFDASKIETKKANEKRTLIFALNNISEDGTIVFDVQYSERGTKTKQDEILKAIKKKGISITEEQLDRAFRVFEKQSEVDFFINKNAKAFLQEQFKLWSYQYFWEGAKEWSADRVNQLQILKDIAFKIIDFISQFEDELVKIWNKPKFVKNSNYVITLDRIKDKELIEKILKHNSIKDQIKEWQELGIIDENFKVMNVFENYLTGKHLAKKYEHLPIDTKYFKDLELEILSQFDDLDKSLDGWLIKSENYQALNTILPKFKEKVQTIYIDPPFNTGDDFDYVDRFQDSSWLSLINNRLEIVKNFLKKSGNIFVQLDWNANHLGRILLQNLFPQCSEIIWNTNATKDEEAGLFSYKSFGDKYVRQHDSLFQCAIDDNFKFLKLWKPNRNLTELNIGWLDLISKPKKSAPQKIEDYDFFIEKYDSRGNLNLEKIDIEEKIFPIGDVWNDIYSFMQSELRTSESLGFRTQKPENLLRRVIQSTTEKNDFVLDYFCGSGTTISVAQKLQRKWVGVEFSDYFNEFWFDEKEKKLGILGRMKIVVSGDKSFTAVNKKRDPHLSKDLNWQGGGFFKYYELEQYEETLANCKYEDGDLFTVEGRSSYQEYVFMKDEKMLKALEIDYENNKVKVDLSKLYPNIDIAETLSNLTGKWIKRIEADKVWLEGMDSPIDIKNIDYKLIKPLIWW